MCRPCKPSPGCFLLRARLELWGGVGLPFSWQLLAHPRSCVPSLPLGALLLMGSCTSSAPHGPFLRAALSCCPILQQCVGLV